MGTKSQYCAGGFPDLLLPLLSAGQRGQVLSASAVEGLGIGPQPPVQGTFCLGHLTSVAFPGSVLVGDADKGRSKADVLDWTWSGPGVGPLSLPRLHLLSLLPSPPGLLTGWSGRCCRSSAPSHIWCPSHFHLKPSTDCLSKQTINSTI